MTLTDTGSAAPLSTMSLSELQAEHAIFERTMSYAANWGALYDEMTKHRDRLAEWIAIREREQQQAGAA